MSFCHRSNLGIAIEQVFKELGYAKDYIYQDGAQLLAFFKIYPDYKLPT